MSSDKQYLSKEKFSEVLESGDYTVPVDSLKFYRDGGTTAFELAADSLKGHPCWVHKDGRIETDTKDHYYFGYPGEEDSVDLGLIPSLDAHLNSVLDSLKTK